MSLKTKRAYEAPARTDGLRVLVNRLWPRGLTKVAAHVDTWLKDVAPSEALRKEFGHDPERWPAFQKGYASELRAAGTPARAALDELVRRARTRDVTLVYAAKDEAHNNAVVLQREIERRLRRPSP